LDTRKGLLVSGITVSLGGLDDFIERTIEEKVEAALASRADDPWLNSDEAAAYLKVARSTLHDAVSESKLPRVGGRKTRLMFRRSTLDEYLASRGRTP
jgi:excisionase family DNA binding protein